MNTSLFYVKYSCFLLLSVILTGCFPATTVTSDLSEPTQSSATESYEVVMTVISNRSLPDLDLVQNAVNEIVEPQIGVRVRLMPITGNHKKEYALMLASNEKIDLIVLWNSVGEFVFRDQILELGDLVQQYGNDIIEAEGIAMSGGYYAGKLYGIPSEQKMGRSYGIMVRSDLVEKYQFDIGAIKTYKDLEPIYQTILDNEPGMIPLETCPEMFRYFHEVDTLGYTLASGCLLNGGADNTTVVNYFATPEYKEFITCMYEWNQKGFFPENPDTLSSFKGDLTRDGMAFSTPQTTELEMVGSVSTTWNRPMTAISFTRDYATTSMYQVTQWAIPRLSENPEKAMEFLNLTYADERIINLLSNGIEGLHYEKTQYPGIIRRPDGVTSLNSGYEMPGAYIGNKALKYVWEPVDTDIFDQLQRFNEDVLQFGASRALGYVFDPTSMQEKIFKVEQIISEFQHNLETGCMDPETSLPLFLSELESEGIYDIIAENQRQLDKWLASEG